MPTTVVFSDVSDGYLNGTDASGSYATAAGSAASAITGVVQAYVGQTYDGATQYDVYQSFLGFDTTGLTGVTSAVLSLVDSTDISTTDFTFECRLHDWGVALTTSDWVAPGSIAGKALLASYSISSGWTGAVYHDFTDVAFAANVNGAGFTRVLINSDRHRLATSPAGDEYASFRSADAAGTTQDPKLTVTNVLQTAALSGTAASGMTEADVVAGGKTIVLTLTGTTFIP